MHDATRFQPIYDPTAVQPMRDELVSVGFQELLDGDDVARALDFQAGTTLLVINSVCGCAAGGARPGAMLALQHDTIPDRLVTVFAGQDRQATEAARQRLQGISPSSPFIALFAEGRPVEVLERHDIEGRDATEIASRLAAAFDRHCQREGPSIPAEEFARISPLKACGSSIPRLDERAG